AHVTSIAAHPLVSTRTEGVFTVLSRAIAGQENNPNFLVHPGMPEGIDDFVDRLGAKGVPRFGTIEGDAGHPVRLMIGDVRIFFYNFPINHNSYLLVSF